MYIKVFILIYVRRERTLLMNRILDLKQTGLKSNINLAGGGEFGQLFFCFFLKHKWETMISGSAFKPGQPNPKKWYKLLFCPSQKTSILNYEL